MQRSGRMVLVAHCILNSHARVAGIASYAGTHPIVEHLVQRGYGIVQLPCPEMEHAGCRRPAATLEDYDTPEFRTLCGRIAERVADQVAEYTGCGYRFDAFIGVEGSPSCAVTREPAPGVFVRELAIRLERYGIPLTAVDRRLADGGIVRVLEELDSL
ncbi:MAG: hypothetical protein Q8M66_01885 [Actinomycetota bacterium]|nr:hypothetical protein [Actinomycetota bacterium]MDZ4179393.1 hypothetical protein [Coriobacteriia bacterium]